MVTGRTNCGYFYVGRVNDVHENGCGSRISVTSTLLESGTRPVFGVLAQVSTTQTSDQSASIQCPIFMPYHQYVHFMLLRSR